ncbi:MAG: endonuclease III [Candidatus Terrybacteria bacterium RIFCSPLOWO2_01_FULL_44_24]|uniref:Endonuclease III n=1 Tax=Candidatus Terrybacteria bacterium RIFCSPHIGHO2_01_FULL_43_35 TaxID=1802361 RepID=A0A1G2PC10_9BACT|nr:MAG: endonuclease III [Candidatus Terrybacteria bacterium RIFCSPHIGHO2_01_FULL_43_35]OHA49640.1 MAG: endonuclease III [Candidatus Terrybacteria bacterium RIFCSPHIGHO2_02_FULL_43_14]OHA51305.1 MAG: endonuclease III [Candidatus Terrybacteria bacterium RIFCSPLOWO2_01_FULL_44_24]
MHKTFFAANPKHKEVLVILKKTYPEATIALKYGNNIQLLVAVILSAQCTDKKVNEVTGDLFKKYKTAKDFTNANIKTFEQEIRSTGFYHNKARNIIAACKIIEKSFNGEVPKTMEEILTLPGVARKTANVVLGNAYGVVGGIAVDTHVKRLSQRLGFSQYDNPIKIEKDLTELFPKKYWFGLTYILIEHGRAICKAPTPLCEKCPVAKLCPTGIKRQGLNVKL